LEPSPALDPRHSRSVPALIRALRSGQLRGPDICTEDRRMCVEYLSGEGVGAGEVAELMQVTERTIMRDRAAFRKANALTPDPEFAQEVAGNLVRRCEASAAKFRRLARDKDTPPAAKIEAEDKAIRVEIDTFLCLQKAGYLPTIGSGGAFDPTNLLSLAPQLEDVAAEAARLKGILIEGAATAALCGTGPPAGSSPTLTPTHTPSPTAAMGVLDQVLLVETRLQLSAHVESVKAAMAAEKSGPAEKPAASSSSTPETSSTVSPTPESSLAPVSPPAGAWSPTRAGRRAAPVSSISSASTCPTTPSAPSRGCTGR
jgi:hypothetical protein